jgi:hypothetical protein
MDNSSILSCFLKPDVWSPREALQDDLKKLSTSVSYSASRTLLTTGTICLPISSPVIMLTAFDAIMRG